MSGLKVCGMGADLLIRVSPSIDGNVAFQIGFKSAGMVNTIMLRAVHDVIPLAIFGNIYLEYS